MKLIESDSPPPGVALAVASLIDGINGEIDHRVDAHRTFWNALWHSSYDGASPALILAALGTRAKLLFDIADENLQHIARLAALVGRELADYIAAENFTPPQAYTIHGDGTVTLD